MLDAEQLDNWREDYAVVQEYVRRAQSGIPSDRWMRGADDYMRLGKACHGLLGVVSELTYAVNALYDDKLRRGDESMEPSADPMRSKT